MIGVIVLVFNAIIFIDGTTRNITDDFAYISKRKV